MPFFGEKTSISHMVLFLSDKLRYVVFCRVMKTQNFIASKGHCERTTYI